MADFYLDKGHFITARREGLAFFDEDGVCAAPGLRKACLNCYRTACLNRYNGCLRVDSSGSGALI